MFPKRLRKREVTDFCSIRAFRIQINTSTYVTKNVRSITHSKIKLGRYLYENCNSLHYLHTNFNNSAKIGNFLNDSMKFNNRIRGAFGNSSHVQVGSICQAVRAGSRPAAIKKICRHSTAAPYCAIKFRTLNWFGIRCANCATTVLLF